MFHPWTWEREREVKTMFLEQGVEFQSSRTTPRSWGMINWVLADACKNAIPQAVTFKDR